MNDSRSVPETIELDGSQARPPAPLVHLEPPRSKSDAQRALVLAAALPASQGGLDAVDLGARPWPSDVEVLRAGLRALAARAGDAGAVAPVELDCRDGGAPFRFLLTQAALAWGRTTRFTGSARLGARPHGPLLRSLRGALGAHGLAVDEGSPWPIVVRAPALPAPVDAFEVTGVESSQFASSLLLGAARLAAEAGRPCAVRWAGAMTSVGYLELTRRWVERAGFPVSDEASGVVVGAPRADAVLPPVPGDWSSLTYLLPVAWRTGATVAHVARGTGHPDEAFAEHLARVGLVLTPPGADGSVRVEGRLRGGFEIDCEVCPDAAPALGALATVLPEPSRLSRVGILRHKESDRVAGVMELARALGAECVLQDDTLTVRPGIHLPAAFEIDAHEDHRLAMAAATAAVLAGARLRLHGADAVKKSFPGFWGELEKVGIVPLATTLPHG